MIHNLTMGHLDREAACEGMAVLLRPLNKKIVSRLLKELGELDEQGRPTLDGSLVNFQNGYLVCRWLGGRTNYVAEEFAIRLHAETGCLLVDREHRRLIDPAQLQGLSPTSTPAAHSGDLA